MKIVRKAGVPDAELVKGRKHYKITGKALNPLTLDKQKFTLTLSATPSDVRAVKKVAQNVRQELARCGIEKRIDLNPLMMGSVEKAQAEREIFELIEYAEKHGDELLSD